MLLMPDLIPVISMSDGFAKRRYRRQVFSENTEAARQRCSLLVLILAGSGMVATTAVLFALTQVSG